MKFVKRLLDPTAAADSLSADTNSGPEDKIAARLLLLGALAGLLIAALSALPAQRRDIDESGAIAKINDRHIDRASFATAYQALLADKSKAPSDADRKLVLDRLIEEELLVQRGMEIGLLDGDAAVRKAIANAVIEFVMTQGGQAQFSEAALRSYYAANKHLFTPADRLQVERIFVRRVDANGMPIGNDESLMRRLDAVRAALLQGEAFGDVKNRLGDELLPELPRTMLPRLKMYDYLGPDLTEKAGRLPEGGISDAIAAGEGWHFLHIVRQQASAPPAFEDIRPQIIDALRRSSDDAALRNYLVWLKSRADIVLADDAPQ